MELVLEPFPLYPLVRKSIMILYSMMKKNNIEYVINFDGSGPLVPMDEGKLQQALLHLIRNSVEAMTEGGNFFVDAREEDGKVSLRFTDDGPGIDPDALPHVKDPFYTTKTSGNGMGLAIVDRIITAHHGHFIISNGKTSGTQATVTLPIQVPAV